MAKLGNTSARYKIALCRNGETAPCAPAISST